MNSLIIRRRRSPAFAGFVDTGHGVGNTDVPRPAAGFGGGSSVERAGQVRIATPGLRVAS